MREFKFIHTSDTEVEACWPPTGLRAHALAVESYWTTFGYLIDAAIENRVDFIVHSGDIAGGQINETIRHYKTWAASRLEVLGRLMAELKRLKQAEIPFFITSGQQEVDLLEFLDKEGLVYYVEMSKPGRAYYELELFSRPGGDKGLREGIGGVKIRVYGLGEAPNQTDRIAKLASDIDMEGIDFGILIGHVWLPELGWAVCGDENDSNPWTAQRLVSEKGVDFIGLGHNHEHYVDLKRHIYNTGSTEWANFDEAGTIFYRYDPKNGGLIETGRQVIRKGFSYVTVKDGQFDVAFMPVPSRTVFNLEIVFHGATIEAVRRATVEALETQTRVDRDAILRPILSGSLAPDSKVAEIEALGEAIKRSTDAVYVEGPKITFDCEAQK